MSLLTLKFGAHCFFATESLAVSVVETPRRRGPWTGECNSGAGPLARFVL